MHKVCRRWIIGELKWHIYKSFHRKIFSFPWLLADLVLHLSSRVPKADLGFKSSGSLFSPCQTCDYLCRVLASLKERTRDQSGSEAPRFPIWGSRHTNMFTRISSLSHTSRWLQPHGDSSQDQWKYLLTWTQPVVQNCEHINGQLLRPLNLGVHFTCLLTDLNTDSAAIWKVLGPGQLTFHHKNFWLALSISYAPKVSTLPF